VAATIAIAKNLDLVPLSGGRLVCVSYAMPVAVFVPGKGQADLAPGLATGTVYKSDRYYSVTTSRHIGQFARRMCGGAPAEVLPHAEFVRHVEPLEVPPW
jgi:hypothetical protein